MTMKLVLGLAVAAISMSGALAEALNALPSDPWKAVESPEGALYSIDYPGGSYPRLRFAAKVEADSFYRVSWQMSCNAENAKLNFFMDSPDGKASWDFAPSSKLKPFYTYIHSSKAGDLAFGLYLSPGAACNAKVKDMSISKLTPADLNGNLVMNGDFEDEQGVPAGWMPRHDTKLSSLSVENAMDAPTGSGCMRIDLRKEASGKLGGLRSPKIPIELGRNYELRLWAKSDLETAIDVNAQVWSIYKHAGEHFYVGSQFPLAKDWKEFSFKVAIPNDLAKYPDLSDKLLFISIDSDASNPKTKVYIDSISFKPAL